MLLDESATALALFSSGITLGAGIGFFLGGFIIDTWKRLFPDGSAPLGLEAWQAFRSGLTDRYEGTAAARSDLVVHGSELKDAALELDFEQSGQAFRELTKDAQSVWLGLATGPDHEDVTDE